MSATQPQVLADVLELMAQLAGDWDYFGPITPETRLLAELEADSLDLVVLGTALQDRYGYLPFSEFFAELGRLPEEEREVTVRDLVEFVCRHSSKVAVGEPR